MFWLLVLMGLATFAPCIILPEWRQYQVLEMAAQVEEHRLEVLQRQVDHERRLLDAVRSDPAVISRLAQRELRFQRVDYRAVRVSAPFVGVQGRQGPSCIPPSQGGTEGGPFVPEPPQPPAIIARAVSLLPDYDYDRVFCDDETRPIVMCMSVGLIGVALGVFGRRQTRSLSG